MSTDVLKPWEGPGVGYTENDIHPTSKVLSILQDEMLPEDLVKSTTLLKDKITRATWEHVLPAHSFDLEGQGDVELKKSKLFHALEVQYSRITALQLFRSIALSENQHISLHARNIPIASLIEDVLKDEREYYDRSGVGELETIHFVGRQKYIRKIDKDLESDELCGILICGMYGMGKTTLAKKICKSAMKKMELRYVDLRKITTEEGAFHGIMLSLTGTNSFVYEKMRLGDTVKNLNKKLLLLLDNADGLMDFGIEGSHRKTQCEKFHELLRFICLQKNTKLKIILTSRFKLHNPEDLAHKTSTGKRQLRLNGAFSEYMIEPLGQTDAMSLLDHNLGIIKNDISADNKIELLQACGFSPMAIQLAASQLRNNLNTTIADLIRQKPNVKPALRNSDDDAPSVTTEFAIGAILQGFMGSILDQVFTSLELTWQTKLIRLSVLESSFDVRAAAACMRSDTSVEATLDLQYLLCRHLVEVMDISSGSGTVNLYREGDVRYVFHTLTAQYLNTLHDREEWRKPVHKAQKRFAVHFRDRLNEIHKMVTSKNVLTIYHEIDENKTHFKSMMHLENDLGIVPKLERDSELRRFTDIPWLYELFTSPPANRRYFEAQAGIALSKKNYYMYCINTLRETYALIHINDIRKIQQNLDQVSRIMSQHEDEFKLNEVQYKTLQAIFFDMKGRYLFSIGNWDEAVRSLQLSCKLYNEVLGERVTTAQAINMLGAAYFRKGNFERARRYHSEAYQMLSSLAEGSLHMDIPVYLMNIGTVYQTIARNEKKNGFWMEANEGFRQAIKYYDMSLDAYHKQNKYGFGKTVDVLRMKANAKYDLEDYNEALYIANEVQSIIDRTMDHYHPMKGLCIAWVGTMYYDYAVQVLSEQPEKSKECTRTFIYAEQRLDEAWHFVCGNDNVPLEDPSYSDLKKFTRKVLKKLGKHVRLQVVERKFKKYEEKRARMRMARNLAPIEMSEEEETESDNDSENEDKKQIKLEPGTVPIKEELSDDNLVPTPSDFHIQHQVAYDSEVAHTRSGLKRPHPQTDSSESDSAGENDRSSSSDEEDVPRWQTCQIV